MNLNKKIANNKKKEAMITKRQLMRELTMLEATVKELASHTKEQLDGLRNDTAAEFASRDKTLQCYNESVKFFRKMIGAILIATGLRDKADVMSRAFEQFEKGEDVKREILKPVQKESDLFSEPAEEDMWIDSKEARELLGWQTISTTMLKGAGIRYQQPLGKHRKITAHKGDIENYIANRRRQ